VVDPKDLIFTEEARNLVGQLLAAFQVAPKGLLNDHPHPAIVIGALLTLALAIAIPFVITAALSKVRALLLDHLHDIGIRRRGDGEIEEAAGRPIMVILLLSKLLVQLTETIWLVVLTLLVVHLLTRIVASDHVTFGTHNSAKPAGPLNIESHKHVRSQQCCIHSRCWRRRALCRVGCV
jgi:hypothetical protein